MTDGPAGYGAPPPAAQPFTIPKDPKEWIVPVGGLLAFIGSIMPWISVKSSYINSSAAGTSVTEGVFVLILGLVVVALGVLPWMKNIKVSLPPVTLLAASGLLFICAIWGLIDVLSNSDSVEGYNVGGISVGGISVGPGIGIWVTLIGAIAAVGGSYLAYQKASKPAGV